ncbi:MAG: XrtA/PEP-CTERM system-associated ATPase [Acetobacteraceae bacterium]|nr:AAA family ATPase [Pseudomonadota bacterium]
MFAEFYKLSGLPFLLTPDTRFFYGSSGHSRAISHLVYGLSQQEGFIVITGEVGAGKTTLVEQLWQQLDRKTYVMARIVTTQVTGDDLLRLVMANFGLGEAPGTDKSTLLRRFEHMVRDQRTQGRRCLLVIDEVQNLSVPALEELRMLSNLTVDGKASLQTILLGQPQFRPIMASPDLEQLRQRVLASYHLGPLTESETRQYIEHRLRTVGWNNDPLWEDAAFSGVFRHTGGIPRRINTLCSRVLLLGALEETHTITNEMVDTTADELNRDLGAGLEPARPRAEPGAFNGLGSAADEVLKRIEALEKHATRQDAVFKRMLELLEANVAGRT